MTTIIKSFYRSIFAKSPWSDQDDDHNDSDDIFGKKRKDKINFDNFNFNFSPNFILIGIIGALLLWLSTGIYKIEEGEKALVLRFGEMNRIAEAGLNYHLPNPIERIYIEKVDKSRRIEIGYRSTGRSRSGGVISSTDIKSESIMLTGDENIVSLYVDVTWHIEDLQDYIFNVKDPVMTARAAAVSAIREVVGNTPITAILSNKKQFIAERIEKLMQQMLNQYGSGIAIEQIKLLRAEPPEEVIAAYRDVQTAKADKEKIINQSEAYRNDILPRARGEAAKVLEEANGYKASVISQAKGDTARFAQIYQQYKNNKVVMKDRLHLEAVEAILRNSNKIIMDGSQLLPHLALDQQKIFNKK